MPCAPGTSDYRERIDFGKIIGIGMDKSGSFPQETTMGMIIYSKNGVHIVPLKPKS